MNNNASQSLTLVRNTSIYRLSILLLFFASLFLLHCGQGNITDPESDENFLELTTKKYDLEQNGGKDKTLRKLDSLRIAQDPTALSIFSSSENSAKSSSSEGDSAAASSSENGSSAFLSSSQSSSGTVLSSSSPLTSSSLPSSSSAPISSSALSSSSTAISSSSVTSSSTTTSSSSTGTSSGTGGHLCDNATLTTGGSISTDIAGKCFKYSTSNSKGTMLSVINGSSNFDGLLVIYGVTNENNSDCSSRSFDISGNGKQENNLGVGRNDDGFVYFILKANTGTYTPTVSFQNWNNGTGCGSAPYPSEP